METNYTQKNNINTFQELVAHISNILECEVVIFDENFIELAKCLNRNVMGIYDYCFYEADIYRNCADYFNYIKDTLENSNSMNDICWAGIRHIGKRINIANKVFYIIFVGFILDTDTNEFNENIIKNVKLNQEHLKHINRIYNVCPRLSLHKVNEHFNIMHQCLNELIL